MWVAGLLLLAAAGFSLGFGFQKYIFAQDDDGWVLTPQIGHTDMITSLVWEPGGNRVAAVDYDNVIVIWDGPTGRELLRMLGHQDTINSLAWSPDGERILTGSSDQTARVWDAGNGRELYKMEKFNGEPFIVAWSPSGDKIMVGYRKFHDTGVDIMDAQTGTVILRPNVQDFQGDIEDAAWSPDGRWIAAGSNQGEILIWESQSGLKALSWPGQADGLNSVAWSPDGSRIITAMTGGAVQIWESKTGRELHTFRLPKGARSASWSPEGGRILVAHGNRDFTVFNDHDYSESAAFEGDGLEAAWSPDGQIIALMEGASIAFFDSRTGRQLHQSVSGPALIFDQAWSPDQSRILGAFDDDTVRLRDSRTGQELVQLENLGFLGNSVEQIIDWSADGNRFLTAGEPAAVWDSLSGRELFKLEEDSDGARSVAWSPEGRRLLTGSDNAACLWDSQTGRKQQCLNTGQWLITSMAWSPDGHKILLSDHEGESGIWDSRDGRKLKALETIHRMAWSPDGKKLVTAFDDYSDNYLAHVRSADGGKLLFKLDGHTDSVISVGWSPDGRKVLTATIDGTIRVWNAANGQMLFDLPRQIGGLTSAVWSPDGLFILSGSRDGSARVWDVESRQELSRYYRFEDGWLMLYPDGRFRAGGEKRLIFVRDGRQTKEMDQAYRSKWQLFD